MTAGEKCKVFTRSTTTRHKCRVCQAPVESLCAQALGLPEGVFGCHECFAGNPGDEVWCLETSVCGEVSMNPASWNFCHDGETYKMTRHARKSVADAVQQAARLTRQDATSMSPPKATGSPRASASISTTTTPAEVTPAPTASESSSQPSSQSSSQPFSQLSSQLSSQSSDASDAVVCISCGEVGHKRSNNSQCKNYKGRAPNKTSAQRKKPHRVNGEWTNMKPPQVPGVEVPLLTVELEATARDQLTGNAVYEVVSIYESAWKEAVRTGVPELPLASYFLQGSKRVLRTIRDYTNTSLNANGKRKVTEAEFHHFIASLAIVLHIGTSGGLNLALRSAGDGLRARVMDVPRFRDICQNLRCIPTQSVSETGRFRSTYCEAGARREVEEALEKDRAALFECAPAFVTVDDQAFGSKSKDVSNPSGRMYRKRNQYVVDCVNDSLFFTQYMTRSQKRGYSQAEAVGGFLDNVKSTSRSKATVVHDRGYGGVTMMGQIDERNLKSLNVVIDHDLGGHAFYPASRDATDRSRYKPPAKQPEKTYTPKVSDEFLVDDEPRLGYDQFWAERGNMLAVACREPNRNASCKVVRFTLMGGWPRNLLMGTYVAVPNSVPTTDQASTVFYPRSDRVRVEEYVEEAESFLTTRTTFWTASQRSAEWFVLRGFTITATLGHELAVSDPSVREHLLQNPQSFPVEPITLAHAFARMKRSWFDYLRSTVDMTRGTVNEEQVAVALGRCDEVVTILGCGMAKCSDNEFIGASPDGIVMLKGSLLNTDEPFWAGLEIKTKIGAEDEDGGINRPAMAVATSIAQRYAGQEFIKCTAGRGDDTWFDVVPREYRGQLIQQAAVLNMDYVILVVATEMEILYKVLITVPDEVREIYLSALSRFSEGCIKPLLTSRDIPQDFDPEAWDLARSHIALFLAVRNRVMGTDKMRLLPSVKLFKSATQSVYSHLKGGVDEWSSMLSEFRFGHLKHGWHTRDAMHILAGLIVDTFCVHRVESCAPKNRREWVSLARFREKMARSICFGTFLYKWGKELVVYHEKDKASPAKRRQSPVGLVTATATPTQALNTPERAFLDSAQHQNFKRYSYFRENREVVASIFAKTSTLHVPTQTQKRKRCIIRHATTLREQGAKRVESVFATSTLAPFTRSFQLQVLHRVPLSGVNQG